MKQQAIPVVFISHGAPFVATEEGECQHALRAFASQWRPRAVLVISAHWETNLPPQITFGPKHSLIYDFTGFDEALYNIKYPAPGNPEVAAEVEALLNKADWAPKHTTTRGLDHGAWVPLLLMYPAADIPVVQLSLPHHLDPQQLHAMGEALCPLAEDGIMIMASGGVVHNLRRIHPDARHRLVDAWAKEFDDWVWQRVQDRDHEALLQYRTQEAAALAVPSQWTEHFDVLFPALGAAGKNRRASSIFQGFDLGNLSMRSFYWS